MDFDAIVGNPPYQAIDGGAYASASPIYQHFVEQAKKINPRYISMIIPARWYAGGKGLDGFREEMLHDERISVLHDFVNASDCFSGVEIKGGVCFFLRDRSHQGDCTIYSHSGNKIVSKAKRALLEKNCDTFIRYSDAIQILHKVQALGEKTFDTIVSARKPFGLATDFRDYAKAKDTFHSIKLYAQKDIGYISRDQIGKNVEWIDFWKVYIPEAIGLGNMEKDIVKPVLGEPNTACTETYVAVAPASNKATAENIISYINTKFFHFLLGLKKISQHTTSKTYSFVPMQDFGKPWADHELYAKYGLTEEEVGFIESSVKSM